MVSEREEERQALDARSAGAWLCRKSERSNRQKSRPLLALENRSSCCGVAGQ
jgi:hypothetical protein